MSVKKKAVEYTGEQSRAYALLTEEPQSTIDLASAFYKVRKVENPSKAMTLMLRAVDKKNKKMDDGYSIEFTPARGPYPTLWWTKKTKAKR